MHGLDAAVADGESSTKVCGMNGSGGGHGGTSNG